MRVNSIIKHQGSRSPEATRLVDSGLLQRVQGGWKVRRGCWIGSFSGYQEEFFARLDGEEMEALRKELDREGKEGGAGM